jgi:20S proteasome subunit beta 6
MLVRNSSFQFDVNHSHFHFWIPHSQILFSRFAMTMMIRPLLLFWCHIFVVVVAAPDFDPYEMNGGLVSAVAGPDFVVVATDTRLSQSYNILGRRHVSSRLWTTTDDSSSSSRDDALSAPDGSLLLVDDVKDSSNDSSSSSVGLKLLRTIRQRRHDETAAILSANVWIASAGCQADCEGLKRNFRSKLRAAAGGASAAAAASTDPASTALALHHELYSHRGFPYYAFCLVAGLTNPRGGGDVDVVTGGGGGSVYVYDAIGSYEQVAVASAGAGREYLQPILDRLFCSDSGRDGDNTADADGGGVAQQQQQHIIRCCTSPEEVVEKLVRAYRAVAEREIAVGDGLVLVSTQRQTDGTCETKIWSSPLKGH